MLLQVLDDGHLTDAQGRRVNFKNTVIVMTSDLGSESLASGRGVLGFGASDAATSAANTAKERALSTLREHFRPEFLNRLDEVIIFQRLTKDQLREITRLLLEGTRRRHAHRTSPSSSIRRPSTGSASVFTRPSTGHGHCGAPSSARSTTRCPGCCSTALCPRAPGYGRRSRTGS